MLITIKFTKKEAQETYEALMRYRDEIAEKMIREGGNELQSKTSTELQKWAQTYVDKLQAIIDATDTVTNALDEEEYNA